MAIALINKAVTQKAPSEESQGVFIGRELLPLLRDLLDRANALITAMNEQPFYTVTDVKTGPYTAALSELVLVNPAAGPITITIPPSNAASAGRSVGIEVMSAAFAVTVTDGVTPVVLPLAVATYFFWSDGL